jgi:hypothetical protein
MPTFNLLGGSDGRAQRFIRYAIIVSELLAMIGVGIAAFVYFHFPIPQNIGRDRLDKFGQVVGPENTILYLFVFPIFQVWIAAMPFLAKRHGNPENYNPALMNLFSRLRKTDFSIEFYQLLLVVLLMCQGLLLAVSIYRSIVVSISSS